MVDELVPKILNSAFQCSAGRAADEPAAEQRQRVGDAPTNEAGKTRHQHVAPVKASGAAFEQRGRDRVRQRARDGADEDEANRQLAYGGRTGRVSEVGWIVGRVDVRVHRWKWVLAQEPAGRGVVVASPVVVQPGRGIELAARIAERVGNTATYRLIAEGVVRVGLDGADIEPGLSAVLNVEVGVVSAPHLQRRVDPDTRDVAGGQRVGAAVLEPQGIAVIGISRHDAVGADRDTAAQRVVLVRRRGSVGKLYTDQLVADVVAVRGRGSG